MPEREANVEPSLSDRVYGVRLAASVGRLRLLDVPRRLHLAEAKSISSSDGAQLPDMFNEMKGKRCADTLGHFGVSGRQPRHPLPRH
jgi:hypothetical protein